MKGSFIPFGEPYHDFNEKLVHGIARETLSVCFKARDFEVVGLRYLNKSGVTSDIIIVDCVNDQVPSRNQYGIKVRERLALVFTPDKLPEVRALRSNFPILPHMNLALPGEPVSLCLYTDTWQTVERSWTPQKHLRRILWWLTESAKGTLHRDNQPLEPLYFESPFEIVLPPDFDEKSENPNLVLIPIPIRIDQPPWDFRVIRGIFQNKKITKTHETPTNNVHKIPLVGTGSGKFQVKGKILLPQERPENKNIPYFTILTITIPSIVHGIIEHYPETLGKLHDQIEGRGSAILNSLKNAIKDRASGGIHKDNSNKCLLILSMQMQRSFDSLPEKNYKQAFEIDSDLANLGEKTEILARNPDGKWYPIQFIGEKTQNNKQEWREIRICPIEVKTAVTKKLARISSEVDQQTADFKGVLAGVGSLGSALAELWAKENWGEWCFIDPDFIEPHNIIRHIAKDFHVGLLKTDVVKEMVEINYQDNYYNAGSISKIVSDFHAEDLKKIFANSEFLVDATTTIEVPRDMSQIDYVPRSASVFLAPSGKCSALLIESADRALRLDALEAQYYRSIINNDWGKDHLEGHRGKIRVGAGCRDVSAIISYEIIQLHAGILARQVRLLRDRPESHIRVWAANLEMGSLVAYEVPVYDSFRFKYGEWYVIIDTSLREKLCEIRMAHLPSETGGVILGYVDQKLKHIYVVDVLTAPPDSEADRNGFTRGVEGLKAVLDDVRHRTANIVDYIGEWHSHPAFISAYPSCIDRGLIKQLADTLELDGQPALMIIVGTTGELSISVKESSSNDVS